MDDREKSDGRVLPAKLPNNAQGGAAEAVEGRRPAKGNAAGETRPGLSAGQGALKRAWSCAPSGSNGQGSAVHRAPAPRRRRPPAGGVLRASAEGRAGGGRGHVGGLRCGARGESSGPARSGSQGRIPGEAVAEGVHTKARWAAAAARCRRVGGQDPSAGAGRGAERHLRDGLPRASPTGSGRGAARITRWMRSPPGSWARR